MGENPCNPWLLLLFSRNLGTNFFAFAPCGSVQLSLSIRDEADLRVW